jgi:uncharacterized protein YbbK (DUF523 family)
MAGLPTPRLLAEIAAGQDGTAVTGGTARVVEADGTDVTDIYLAGARLALDQAIRHGCRHALLTDGSPSCGGDFIYDGSFQGRRIEGAGVTAALLRQHGIAVFAPGDLSALAAALGERDRFWGPIDIKRRSSLFVIPAQAGIHNY